MGSFIYLFLQQFHSNCVDDWGPHQPSSLLELHERLELLAVQNTLKATPRMGNALRFLSGAITSYAALQNKTKERTVDSKRDRSLLAWSSPDFALHLIPVKSLVNLHWETFTSWYSCCKLHGNSYLIYITCFVKQTLVIQ